MPLIFKAIIVGAVLLVLLLAERLRPNPLPNTRQRGKQGRGRLGVNIGLWLINAGLSPLVVVPLTAYAAGLSPFGAAIWRPALPWPAGLLADLLLLDLFIYWWHRASHVVPFIWRFHAVHHLDRDMDVTTSVRFHFGEVLMSATARAGLILIAGIPLTHVLVFETVLLLASAFHHSRVQLPRGLEAALSWVIVTPSLHWVHHNEVPADCDGNYATVLSLWDRLFRSRSPGRRRDIIAIGVEGAPDQRLTQLLALPFSPRAANARHSPEPKDRYGSKA